MAKSSSIRHALRRLLPAPIVQAYRARAQVAKAARELWEGGEPEARLLPVLCSRQRLSIDIGGNEGAYTVHMRRCSRAVEVFEPIPDLARRLAVCFRFDRRVRIHNQALSDHAGTTTLRLPLHHGHAVTGLASIEPDNELRGLPVSTLDVALCRLDDLGFRDVGFIKLDVEGHEVAVLRGAERLLRESRRNLLIEAAEHNRPGAVAAVAATLTPLGYQGVFLYRGALLDVEAFDAAVHQPAGALNELSQNREGVPYSANFIWSMERDRLRTELQSALAASPQ